MNQKKWNIADEIEDNADVNQIIKKILKNRGFTSQDQIDNFINPPNPNDIEISEAGINPDDFDFALKRIIEAIEKKQSIVVYGDYDADGITAASIMWEACYKYNSNTRPYIPHRIDEGYGLSEKGIDYIKKQYKPDLIITVDHGITGWDKVEYAKKHNIDSVVTDHHVKPEKLPQCPLVHTTSLSGAGISWLVAREIIRHFEKNNQDFIMDLLSLASIGTIADMVFLLGPNRSIVKYGLDILRITKRPGLVALMEESALDQSVLDVYGVSFVLTPRLNAMGRLEHALDSLRLICARNQVKARQLSSLLGATNRERQQLTHDAVLHAVTGIDKDHLNKLIFISHQEYNQGIIGLVAGKLVESYYRPSIVVAVGDVYSKASARSIPGFNIVEAIRSMSDILVDVGGHPMAAGFTVETVKIEILKSRLEEYAEANITDDNLIKTLSIDLKIPFHMINIDICKTISALAPFGLGNPQPVFMTPDVLIVDSRLVGSEGKHLKLKVKADDKIIDAIGFGMGSLYSICQLGKKVDIVYNLDINFWNGKTSIQLKVKDIRN